MRNFIKTIVLLLKPAISSAQKNNNNSLRQALENATTDSARFFILVALGTNFSEVNWDSALYYSDKSLLISVKNDKKIEEAYNLSFKGYILMKVGKLSESLQNFQLAFNIAEDPANESKTWLQDKNSTYRKKRLDALMNNHHNMGHLMRISDKLDETIFHYNETKKLALEIGDINVIGYVNMNLGRTYIDLNKLDSALEMEEKAVQIFNQTSDKEYLSRV